MWNTHPILRCTMQAVSANSWMSELSRSNLWRKGTDFLKVPAHSSRNCWNIWRSAAVSAFNQRWCPVLTLWPMLLLVSLYRPERNTLHAGRAWPMNFRELTACYICFTITFLQLLCATRSFLMWSKHFCHFFSGIMISCNKKLRVRPRYSRTGVSPRVLFMATGILMSAISL